MNLFRFSIIACAFIGALHAMEVDSQGYPVITVRSYQGSKGTAFKVTTRATMFAGIATDASNADMLVDVVDVPREFMRAVITENHPVIQYLATRDSKLTNASCPDHCAWTPITYAIAVGKTNVIAQLIALGADLSTKFQVQDGSLKIDDTLEMFAERCEHAQTGAYLKAHNLLCQAAKIGTLDVVTELMASNHIYPNPVAGGTRLLDQIPATGVVHGLLSAKLAEFNRQLKTGK